MFKYLVTLHIAGAELDIRVCADSEDEAEELAHDWATSYLRVNAGSLYTSARSIGNANAR